MLNEKLKEKREKMADVGDTIKAADRITKTSRKRHTLKQPVEEQKRHLQQNLIEGLRIVVCQNHPQTEDCKS
jgi:hypothetical protein